MSEILAKMKRFWTRGTTRILGHRFQLDDLRLTGLPAEQLLMERRLRDALEEADSKMLMQLCRKLDSNPTLTVRHAGVQVTQTLVHHVTCLPVSLRCLRALIDRLGPDCLTCPNWQGNWPLHLAARHQDASWIREMVGKLGLRCLDEAGFQGRTVAHFAAQNTETASVLRWVLRKRGLQLLITKDAQGWMPAHLAAAVQESPVMMELILRQLGASSFLLPGPSGRSACHCAAANLRGEEILQWLVERCGCGCLGARDSFGDSPVHLAAQHQGPRSMELMKRQLGGSGCFHWLGHNSRTAVHSSATSLSGNGALKWLVIELGSHCLRQLDAEGSSPLLLAAVWQGADSLQFIADRLGCSDEALTIRGFNGWTAAHCAAQNGRDGGSALAWCVRNLPAGSLLAEDRDGRTPAHLAAQHLDGDALSLISKTQGNWAFEMADEAA